MSHRCLLIINKVKDILCGEKIEGSYYCFLFSFGKAAFGMLWSVLGLSVKKGCGKSGD